LKHAVILTLEVDDLVKQICFSELLAQFVLKCKYDLDEALFVRIEMSLIMMVLLLRYKYLCQ